MTRRAALVAFAGAIRLRPESLAGQSAARLLERAFPNRDISYLLLDFAAGDLAASRWPRPNEPAALGSLVKPFTALAYGEQHAFRYPDLVCRGTVDGCWLPDGHGRLSLVQAIANSCNAWFLSIASVLDVESVSRVAIRFGLAPPPPDATFDSFIGLGTQWPVAPVALLSAYRELAARRSDPRIAPLFEGMRLSARNGTARAVGPRCYAKTGTAVCGHVPRGMGDGYAIALYPLESPRQALLTGVHGTTGAHAAQVCGRMLAALRSLPA